MIRVLTGENTFEIDRALQAIISGFDGTSERFDGLDLELRQLPDLLMGVSLFASKRLVIISGLSENKSTWAVFGDWLGRVSDDIQLVLIEPKLDKRTVTYKELKKLADISEFNLWSDRDHAKAASWLIDESKKLGLAIDAKQARLIVRRVGINQWALFRAIEKLALLEEVTVSAIEDVIDANPTESVFGLLEAALSDDRVRLSGMLAVLEQTEDAFRLLALLSSQVFQMAAAAVAGDDDSIVKDFGVHPYVASRLSAGAKDLGRGGARKLINIFAKADDDIKLSRGEPWLIIERALMQVASL
jgi:DNA polymerase III delta subunit